VTKHRHLTRIAAGILMLLLAAALPALAGDAPVIKATLEPALIGLGETTLLSIEVRTTNLSSAHFRPDFKLENLEIVSGPSQWDNVQISNGSFSRTFRMSWRLRPFNTGKAAVRSLQLQLDDELVHMRDREVTVQEDPTGQTDEAPADPAAEDPFDRFFGPLLQREAAPARKPAVFLRAEAQPQRPYVGQQVLYTVYLYTRDDISSMASREMPTFRGFWVRDVPQPQHLPTDMVTVGNERFGRVVVLQKALFPLRPGHHSIEPASMDVLARVVEPRWFGPPLSRPEQVALQTTAVPLDVQPLPPAPPGFAGAVGQLALTARLDPPRLRLGEAATLTVTLAGRGNVQGVAVPQIAPPPGVELLPPQQQGDERLVGTTVQGARTWSWAVVPRRAGEATLHVPEIPFFDPLSGRYKTASAPPLSITTLAPVAAPSAPGLPRSIRVPAAEPAWGRLLPWFAVPCAIALALTLARRRRHADPALPQAAGGSAPAPSSGTPAAYAAALHRFQEAESAARPRQAAGCIEEAWREFLSRRWGVPPGTPPPRWGEVLRTRGADPEAAAELARLAGDLNYLRYAPQLSATGALGSEALDRSRRLLRRLR
jgi:BatD DUF11 like domain